VSFGHWLSKMPMHG